MLLTNNNLGMIHFFKINSNMGMIHETKQFLSKNFDIKDLGGILCDESWDSSR